MTDTPAHSVLASPKPQPATTPKAGHRITDPGDASPLGHPEGSDFEPRQTEPVPYEVTEVLKPGVSSA